MGHCKLKCSLCSVQELYAMRHCKLKCSLCSVQEVWWSLHWVLRPAGWAGALLG